MNLSQICQPTCFKVPLENREKDAVIQELIDLVDEHGLLANKDAVTDAVFTRERTRSTGIGSGIAIPHGKSDGVKQLVVAFGLTRQSVDFDSIDDKPVSIVILLVSPPDQTGPHIQALAKISRLMLDEQFRVALIEANNPDQAFRLLHEKEMELDRV